MKLQQSINIIRHKMTITKQSINYTQYEFQ
jgi:hypothetical protein